MIHYTERAAKPARCSVLIHCPDDRNLRQVYTSGSMRQNRCMVLFEWSRQLNSKERKSFEYRATLLAPGSPYSRSIDAVMRRRGEFGHAGHSLVLRQDYVYLRRPIDSAVVSDRTAPARELRPPATRISSSQGSALRFHLAALHIAQATNRRGSRGQLPDLALAAFSGKLGWTDVFASAAVESGAGNDLSTVRDKKSRTLRSILRTLDEAKLVALHGPAGKSGRHEGFTLRHEGGRQNEGDPIPYVVPTDKDLEVFSLPAGFIANGWVHVLADSEINLLLMVASGRAGLFPWGDSADLIPGEVAIPAEVRLRHYGIHRDPFSVARKTLAWFGLLSVREVGRHDDGRAQDDEHKLHRLSLNVAGFDQDAPTVLRDQIHQQLARPVR